MKKIDPMKKVVAGTTGLDESQRLNGTPTTKHAEPMTNSHAIQRTEFALGVFCAGFVTQ